MNENIDLTKILDGCPKGTEFYHTVYGRAWLVCIDLCCERPIRLSLHNDSFVNTTLTEKGTFSTDYDGECLLFPSKDQRDWSKFERFWDKPKVEKFDVNTLQPFDKVLVRYAKNPRWECGLFSSRDLNNDFQFKCVGCMYEMCIPYNEETKHLVGTTDEAPEYYRCWEK